MLIVSPDTLKEWLRTAPAQHLFFPFFFAPLRIEFASTTATGCIDNRS